MIYFTKKLETSVHTFKTVNNNQWRILAERIPSLPLVKKNFRQAIIYSYGISIFEKTSQKWF